MKNFTRIIRFVTVYALILVCCYCIGMYAARCVTVADVKVSPSVEATEVVDFFDTNSLESWCGCGGNGKIRMLGAVVREIVGNSIFVVDTTGEVWELENHSIEENDFLLLWIADSHTEEVEDDCVIKVWVESYEILG